MQISQISDRVEQLACAWEQFKSVNDSRLASLEKKNSYDPLDLEQLRKINIELDDQKSRINQMETAVSRPELGLVDHKQLCQHHKSFSNYLRKGAIHELAQLEQKSLSTTSDADGGYLISTQMSKQITTDIRANSPLRQLVQVEEISSDSLDILEDLDKSESGWVAETEMRADTKTPQISKKRILVHELYAQPKATQRLIDDASIDIAAWLADKIATNFAEMENTSFLHGDGKGKPRGILSYQNGNKWGQIEQLETKAIGINTDDLMNLYYGLDSKYAARASFMLHRNQLQTIRMLKDPTSGQYIWSPGLAASAPDTLLGAAVIESSDMPLPVSGNLSVIFADFRSAYKIVDRTGIRVLRDPFTDKPFVKFYTTKRVGGDVVNFSAVKLLKIGK